MRYTFILLFSFGIFFTTSSLAQSKTFIELENKVDVYNHEQKFASSINLINTFISQNETSYYDTYSAYLLKAKIFKSLFNYKETFINLDLALENGLKTDKREEVEAVVLAEKTFAYFDIQDYKKSIELMSQLKKSNYKYIEDTNVGYLIMQEGYID